MSDQVRCAIDGVSLDAHPRCAHCTILAGPGHLTPALSTGVCPACVESWRRQTQRMNVAS